MIETAEDTTRSGRSIFGRCEAFADARNESSTAGITAAAKRMLAAGKPTARFSGKIVDTPGTRYGVHWRWGDKVTVAYEGQSYNALVKAVRVTVDGDGAETIEARLEV